MLILWHNFGGFSHLEAFIFRMFQVGKDNINASARVSGRWMHIFHIIFHEVKIEELPQWTPTQNYWDVFPTIFHFEHLPIQHMFWWLKGVKT
jgi:hypothetical protein